MREVVLTVPARAVEGVLDRLLPIVPGGVRERPLGDSVELRMRGHELPARDAIARCAGPLPHRLSEGTVPDDWRERRLADYREDLIGGRLVVRPEWAPPPAGAVEFDIALSDDLAFGSGSHPTTRAILEILLETEPAGSFADLGCGSVVLGILAARLGWAPVAGVELVPGSVDSARANATRNGVAVEVTVGDLSVVPPPAADGFAANIPAPVHAVVARSPELARARWGVLSGFGPKDDAALIPAYARAGLVVRRQSEVQGWSVIVVERDG
jgi:ribosomal protein L11 methyltransferase